MSNEHTTSEHENSDEWYWDLRRNVAVPAAERGPVDDLLGPYPSRAAAENWKSTVDERNKAWEADDEAWETGSGNATPGSTGGS